MLSVRVARTCRPRTPAPIFPDAGRTRLATLSVAALLLGCVRARGADPAPRTAPPRRALIESGWDEPDPAFMRRHLAEMERTPFDGCVFHVSYPKRDGTSGNFTWEAWGRRAFAPAELESAR